MKLRRYTLEQLQEAIRTSDSLREVLSALNIIPAGGNYEVLKKAIKYYNLDTSHFTGQAWSRGKKLGSRYTLDQVFNREYTNTNRLRQRLIREKIFPHQCSNCKRRTWKGVPIPLELDHCDGDRTNNSLTNLRLLCPNCHALTPTYRSKNRASMKLRSALPPA